jgi:hypothetical protein
MVMSFFWLSTFVAGVFCQDTDDSGLILLQMQSRAIAEHNASNLAEVGSDLEEEDIDVEEFAEQGTEQTVVNDRSLLSGWGGGRRRAPRGPIPADIDDDYMDTMCTAQTWRQYTGIGMKYTGCKVLKTATISGNDETARDWSCCRQCSADLKCDMWQRNIKDPTHCQLLQSVGATIEKNDPDWRRRSRACNHHLGFC